MNFTFLVWLIAFFIQLGLLGVSMYGVRDTNILKFETLLV
jgi:hypothetical protein